MADDNSVSVRLAVELGEALGALADAIEQFAADCAVGGEVPFRLNLALDELVTNSINYALPTAAEPELRLRLNRTADCVIAQLEYSGVAFDPFNEAPKPDTSLALENRPIGGLGVFFVKQFTDSASYEWEEGVNRVTLRMNLET